LRFVAGAAVAVELFRVDDRLIHGQVVLGWAKPMNAGFIMLVDDAVATSEWEQELYRMAVPAHIELIFADVAEGARRLGQLSRDPRPGIVLTGDVLTMTRMHEQSPTFSEVNLGGLHTGPGRVACARYVYLSANEENQLRSLEERGVRVTAQDLPVSRQIPLDELIERRHAS
jgi:mannose/fructose/N-acetylgalactosamine-specific phosphotransferase system component IIB